MSDQKPPVVPFGAKVPCCESCRQAAAQNRAGFRYGKATHEGLNADGEPGTKEKPCKPCGR